MTRQLTNRIKAARGIQDPFVLVSLPAVVFQIVVIVGAVMEAVGLLWDMFK